MAAIAEAVAGAISGIGNLASSIYNIGSDLRNYDYQKALQQKIFAREDTAVQRRMADLQAAGLNPQLAAGSGAGAGTVVNTKAPQFENNNPLGAALDMASHVEQLRQQKIQTENLKKEGKLLDNQSNKAMYDATIAEYNAQYMANENDYLFGNHWTLDNMGFLSNREAGKFWDLMDFQFNSKKNTADMLQKQNDMYTTQQIMNLVSQGIGDITDIAGGFNHVTNGIRVLSGNYKKRR